MREIVLDTETTGFNPDKGDRLVEIGCIELVNHVATGNHYHQYINPEREVPEDAVRVHGLTYDFLKEKPVFADVAQGFIDFIGSDPLIIHNAAFDMKFLNFEIKLLGRPEIPYERAIDTLAMARKKFPGSPATLDALCRRFAIDNTSRTLHGALLDSELLAEVYLELIGGRQPGMDLAFGVQKSEKKNTAPDASNIQKREKRAARHFPVPEQELQAHAKMLEKLKDPVWLRTAETSE